MQVLLLFIWLCKIRLLAADTGDGTSCSAVPAVLSCRLLLTCKESVGGSHVGRSSGQGDAEHGAGREGNSGCNFTEFKPDPCFH